MKPTPVFLIALAICVPMGLWGVLAPEAMAGTVLGLTTWFMVGASWWWLALCSGFVIFAAVLALGPWGRIRLGADDDRPEFSTVSWIAMDLPKPTCSSLVPPSSQICQHALPFRLPV